MPLSRHFYSLDEVQAALLHTNSLFWCQELILSGCIGEAISTLFQSWLWNTGPMQIQWLIDAWKTLALDEISEENILLATYKLSTIHNRDSSLWNILVLTIQDPNKMPDTVTRKTPIFATMIDEKELYFMRAIFQGKARSAWWISQFIDDEKVWSLLDLFAENTGTEHKIGLEALKGYEQLLGYKSTEYDIIIRCAAVLMMCIRNGSFKPFKEIDIKVIEINRIIGRKKSRMYPIPNEYLYGITARGRSKWSQNNFIQLNNVEKYVVGCPFWDEVLDKVLDKVLDDEFYETYFPDDIPDEWSKQEKEKSHGGGVLGPDEKVCIWKYSRNFMSNVCYLSWNTTKTVNNYLKGLDVDSIESFIKLYVKPSSIDLNCLKPVRKMLVI